MGQTRIAWGVLAVLLAGCGATTARTAEDAGAVDAGPAATDAGPGGRDAGPVDAGPRAEPDAGAVDAGPADAGPAAPPRLPTDVAIGEVSLYQAVKVTLASGGAAVARTSAPVVAGRDALVRVGVAPQAGFAARTLTCELELGGQRFSQTLGVHGASSDALPGSFFVFQVPAAALTPTATWSARLLDPAAAPVEGSAASAARIPASGGAAPLGARTDAGGLQLVLVPVQWNGDGSGRLPDTGTAQLQIIRDLLSALYPLVQLDLTVHAPLPYSGGYTWSGNVDFGDVNAQLQQLRADDQAPDKAYYYALVAPEATFDAYCGRGCVTGQSYVVDDPADATLRVGSGQGWAGENAAWTLAHEVGHELGRYHAPCGAGSPDPQFPDPNGSIGVWGYDRRSGAFEDPGLVSDFMGYCDDTWASDYTYGAIFDRLLAVHGAAPRGLATRRPFRFLAVDGLGHTAWRRPLQLRKAPSGPQALATWLDEGGAVLGREPVTRLALAEGDEVEYALPAPPPGATRLLLDDAGVQRRVDLP
jgi:hypothetical protein